MNHLYVPIEDPLICFHNTQSIFSEADSRIYHRHNACEIFVLIKGTATFYVEHSCYELKRGDMIILASDELHRSIDTHDSDYESVGINIHDNLLNKLSSDQTSLLACFNQRNTGETNLIHMNELELSSFLSHFRTLSALLTQPTFGSDLLVNAYLTQIVVKINQLYSMESVVVNHMPELVQQTMYFIKDNLTSSIGLKDLEEQLNYNGTYISYCFKQHTGLTIREYIVDQRILAAKRFLSVGYSVQESCELSGFNDYSNFIRSFSKVAGVTPGKFKSQKNQ